MHKTRQLTSADTEVTWKFLLNDIFQNSSLVLSLKKKKKKGFFSNMLQHLFCAHKIKDP